MDREASLAHKAQKILKKWLIFVALGVIAYGGGLYYGHKKYEYQLFKIRLSEPTLPSDSLNNSNNTENQK